MKVRSTKGSAENLDLLRNIKEGVDSAFVQGGVGDPVSMPELSSLASLYFEPCWVFKGAQVPANRLSDLQGRRIVVGQEGSGTRALALLLLKENGIDEGNTSLFSWDSRKAERSLRSGEVDAAFFVASPMSSFVRRLIKAEGISLMGIERAEAYARVHPFLNKVILPEGVVDFRENIPGKDIPLLAASATLVIREDFHPALINLVLQAASEVHGRGGIFEGSYQFPSPTFVDFPIQKEALRYFKSGPPFLQKYLPFWAASLIDRLKVMLLPVLTLAVASFQGGPAHVSVACPIAHYSLVPRIEGRGPDDDGRPESSEPPGISGRTRSDRRGGRTGHRPAFLCFRALQSPGAHRAHQEDDRIDPRLQCLIPSGFSRSQSHHRVPRNPSDVSGPDIRRTSVT